MKASKGEDIEKGTKIYDIRDIGCLLEESSSNMRMAYPLASGSREMASNPAFVIYSEGSNIIYVKSIKFISKPKNCFYEAVFGWIPKGQFTFLYPSELVFLFW